VPLFLILFQTLNDDISRTRPGWIDLGFWAHCKESVYAPYSN